MAFQKAVKRDAKLRLALCGPAGSGKTFTGLSVATALGGPVAYVDTEHGSASKYAHTDRCGSAGPKGCSDPSHFEFDVEEPASFDPRDLIDFIDEAVKRGYKVICIDSLSHYWMGPNGELDLVDATAKRDTRGNSFAAWKTVTPIHNSLVDKILSAPIHVIVSMRTKTEWVVEKDEKTGKSVPRKIGLAPIMRDGIEFEFDVCGDLDQDNNFTVTKSRCSALAGKVINRPGKGMAASLSAWLGSGPDLHTTLIENAGPENGSGSTPTGETRGHSSEEARNNVKSQTGPSMEKGKQNSPVSPTPAAPAQREASATASPVAQNIPPSAPVDSLADLPAPVKSMWDRMGTRKDLIIHEVQKLRGSIEELTSFERANEEYAAIVKQYGDPVAKVGFARRAVLELWKRIQEIYAEQLAAAEPQPGEQPMLIPMETKTEVAYGN